MGIEALEVVFHYTAVYLEVLPTYKLPLAIHMAEIPPHSSPDLERRRKH